MSKKTRLIVLLGALLALTLMVGVASAGSVTSGDFTLAFPNDFASCNPEPGTVSVSGLEPYHRVMFVVAYSDGSSGWTGLASSTGLAPDANGVAAFGFAYPAIEPPGLQFYVYAAIFDASTAEWQLVGEIGSTQTKWTVTCEPPADACTPGYWRQDQHYDEWAVAGYDPNADFDTTFGVDYFDPDITLGEAAWLGGGGVNKVARFGVASLLSAAHPDVDFGLTVSEVIALVQAGDGDTLASYYPDDGYVCPLD